MKSDTQLFCESSLSDSAIYQSFNNNAEMTKSIIEAMNNSLIIDESYIEEQILQISRTKISPLSDSVLNAFRNGDVVILYVKNAKVPTALPFFVTKVKGVLKSFVFINNYGTISKSEKDSSVKYLNISMKDLYVLMEAAYIALQNVIYPIKLNKNLQLMKISCSIYVNMLLRILNKEYSLTIDPILNQNVTFAIGRFFMERVWGYTNENVIFTYAKSNIVGTVNNTELLTVNETYTDDNIKNIEDLFNFLKTLSTRLAGINYRYILQCYINTYKAPCLFGLECLPYFMFAIQCTLLGSFIVNQKIISDITKNTKNMNQFYPELIRVVE